jgi:hypothetical protein
MTHDNDDDHARAGGLPEVEAAVLVLDDLLRRLAERLRQTDERLGIIERRLDGVRDVGGPFRGLE